jgi:anhydro-N-acetylmuramic acid kinase
VAFLHLGAVAGLTWVDAADPDPARACLAFDCGPGLAALPPGSGAGQVDDAMLHGFVQHPFFARRPPKRLAAPLLPEVGHLGPDDARATLAAAVAAGVVLGFEHFPRLPAQLWVIGPGRGDGRLMPLIAAGCDIPVAPIDDAGLDGAWIAAQSVAFAAARVARGLPTTAPGTTGAAVAVGGGVLSRPGAPPP